MAVLARNVSAPFRMDAKKTEEFFRKADRTAYTRAVERAMAHKNKGLNKCTNTDKK